jgi:hypothetical protein
VTRRRDARTLAGLNGDMMARAEVMHRCGVGRSTQGDQKAQGQNGTHFICSQSTTPAPCDARAAPPQPVAASRSIKLAGLWGMPDLTRRKDPHRADCWLIYFGDVHVGTYLDGGRKTSPVRE